MKKAILTLAIAAFSIPLSGTLRPAEAGVRWVAGLNFSVGGAYFSLGFDDHYRRGHHSAPRYLYRTSDRLQYRGYECGSACYIRDRYQYHDRSCPVVGQHFRRYGFDSYYAWGTIDHGRRGYSGHHERSYAYPRSDYGHHYRRDYDRHDRSYRAPSHHDRGHSRHYRGCGH